MSTSRLVVLGLLLALAGAALPACEDAETDPGQVDALAQDVNRYVVRGTVSQIPAPAGPQSEFLVRHEPIPAFKANYRETTPTGMNAMIMPFPLAEGVTTEGLSVGDKITLEFVVFYDPDTGDIDGWETTSITPLPPETELNFGRAAPDEAVEIEAQKPSNAEPEDDEPSNPGG